MAFRVEYTAHAVKQLKKMDRFDARLIVDWVGKHLEGAEDLVRLARGSRQTGRASGVTEWATTDSSASSRTRCW